MALPGDTGNGKREHRVDSQQHQQLTVESRTCSRVTDSPRPDQPDAKQTENGARRSNQQCDLVAQVEGCRSPGGGRRQVQRGKGERSNLAFEFRAEYVQRPHVEQEMRRTAMQERSGEHSPPLPVRNQPIGLSGVLLDQVACPADRWVGQTRRYPGKYEQDN